MRRHPAFAAAIVAGLFTLCNVGIAYSAGDNTAAPPEKPAPFDHKSLGKDTKDCEKCHKLPKSHKEQEKKPEKK